MRYSQEPIARFGIRVVRANALMSEILTEVQVRLNHFYRTSEYPRELVFPPIPSLHTLGDGETKFDDHRVVLLGSGHDLGYIAMNYFKRTRRQRPRRGVDYPASPTFSTAGKPPYESLSLFFYTENPPDYKGNSFQRRMKEREDFLGILRLYAGS